MKRKVRKNITHRRTDDVSPLETQDEIVIPVDLGTAKEMVVAVVNRAGAHCTGAHDYCGRSFILSYPLHPTSQAGTERPY